MRQCVESSVNSIVLYKGKLDLSNIVINNKMGPCPWAPAPFMIWTQGLVKRVYLPGTQSHIVGRLPQLSWVSQSGLMLLGGGTELSTRPHTSHTWRQALVGAVPEELTGVPPGEGQPFNMRC